MGCNSVPPGEENLGDGLVLHAVRDEHDAERFMALNEAVTGEGAICDRLLHHHPETGYGDYLIVEDRGTGQAVSTTCLIPWRCCYEDVVLNVAMLEMVVTHPAYRRRGLVRAQVRRFHHMVARRGFDLCIIQGIPYYYRQYGYVYALDHASGGLLPARSIPGAPPGVISPYRLRPATPDDAETLAGLYREAMAGYQVYVHRPLDYWRYLLRWGRYPVRWVEDVRTGRAVGYACVSLRPDGRRAWVRESSATSHEVGMAILQRLKAEACGEIQLDGGAADTLVRLARDLGSRLRACDQWLLRIPDVARFLARSGLALERRLARSGCPGLTGDLCVNLFREAIVLHFEAGRLLEAEPAGFVDASLGADGGDLCIPPQAFVRLVFGYRSLDELRDAWPDIVVKPGSRDVLEALFPRLSAHIHMPY